LHRSETLYSWCGHAHALNGGTNALKTSMMLFGAPYSALSHDFPSHVDRLTQATDGCLGPKRTLELEHTLLGYFLVIAGRTPAEAVLTTVESGAAPHLKMLLGITASRVGGGHPLKACLRCMGEDERNYGWAYWHTEHQLPSSYVCEKHSDPLIVSADPITPVHRRTWKLPSFISPNEWQTLRIPETALGSLTSLARNSCQMSRMRPGSLTQERLASTYRNALFRMGLSTKHGNLRVADIHSLVEETCPELVTVPVLARLTRGAMGWTGIFASISRRAHRPAHPLKHLVVITSLFEGWTQFMQAYESTSDPAAEVASVELRPSKRGIKKAEFEQLVNRNGLSVTAASRAAGVATTTGTQWAKSMGIGFLSRPKRVDGSMEKRASVMLAKGIPTPLIAESIGVSQTTVHRLLGSNDALQHARKFAMTTMRRHAARRAFSRACKANSKLPLSAIRSMPNNSYMWLHRHDRSWLDQKLVELGRVSKRRQPTCH
jgi:hypothetical protein